MKKFLISESEKQRILGMHKNAIRKEYLTEDDVAAKLSGLMNNIVSAANTAINTYNGANNSKVPNVTITSQNDPSEINSLLYSFNMSNQSIGEVSDKYTIGNLYPAGWPEFEKKIYKSFKPSVNTFLSDKLAANGVPKGNQTDWQNNVTGAIFKVLNNFQGFNKPTQK
jgi:hypothetical protein